MSDSRSRCALCGDEALPALVRTVDPETGTVEVELHSEIVTVATDLVEGVEAGDTILVHQGFAIARVGTQ